MKHILNTAVTSVAILISSNAIAAKPLSENQLLGQCKALANSQFEEVKKVKMTKMKNTRGRFEAKFRVSSASDKGVFLCTIERGEEANIVRIDGKSASIASTK